MSKYYQGYLGAQQGKLGNAVGRRWKGRNVMAVYQPQIHDPRTTAQQIVRARFGRLDLFVNNAGITLKAPFLEMTEADFDRNCAVDFKAPYFCMQEAARMMSGQEGAGNIVAIASNNAFCQFAQATAYAAMKAGLVKMVRSIALEMARYHIRVNAIAPGAIHTAMVDSIGGLAAVEGMISGCPLKRVGQPEDIAAAVTFLASPAAGQISGTGLDVDGGLNA